MSAKIIQFPDTLDKQIQREIVDIKKSIDAEILECGGLEEYGKQLIRARWPSLGAFYE